MIFLLSILSFLTFAYLIVLIWLGTGIRRLEKLNRRPAVLKNSPKNHKNFLPSVALIICARNEAHRLPRLLRALKQLQYPQDKLEICLVDDRSSDGTSELIKSFAAQHANVVPFRFDDTVSDFAPKKRAIDAAIRHSTGEIVLLTDADAAPGPLWIHEMVATFTPEVIMVCGYSPYTPRGNLWQRMLALEYFSYAAVAAGGIGAGQPLTCVGSNLAYRRDAYLRIGGFDRIEHWISGDDDLFLHKMHRAGIGKIFYVAHLESHAPVSPPRSWQEFKAQRTRYASKSLHYQPSLTLALVFVYLLNLLLCVGWLSALLGLWEFFIPALIIGVVKAVGEYLYLRRAATLFAEEMLLSVFSFAAFFHPFYLVFFATRGQFARFSWREEEFTAKKSL
jgi:cellulose synthase/poly-beta-1,6-N-acetylglucosamine synthase-like glycosyltransferase